MNQFFEGAAGKKCNNYYWKVLEIEKRLLCARLHQYERQYRLKNTKLKFDCNVELKINSDAENLTDKALSQLWLSRLRADRQALTSGFSLADGTYSQYGFIVGEFPSPGLTAGRTDRR